MQHGKMLSIGACFRQPIPINMCVVKEREEKNLFNQRREINYYKNNHLRIRTNAHEIVYSLLILRSSIINAAT